MATNKPAGDVTKANNSETVKELRNEDPISGAAGAHPVGAGVGAALGGAAAGAAAGSVLGPIGTVAGVVVGGVAGGLAGKAVGENLDPTVEVEYWRSEYANRPYYDKGVAFEEYETAYRAGAAGYDAARPGDWSQHEPAIQKNWESSGNTSTLQWEQARHAAKDAYTRACDRPCKPK